MTTLALPLRLEGIQIIDANGTMIALVRGEMGDYRERGAQIVNAVNSHTELLAAARMFLEKHDRFRRAQLQAAIAHAE